MSCTEADYAFLRQFILSRSENVLDPSRNDLFEARLYRVVQRYGMSGLDELVQKLRFASDPALDQSVVEAMTINETSFFRDQAPFELMRQSLIPALIKQRENERRLRFWSAACSSGQEAYSLAMMLRQHFPQLAGWDIQILGTDINAEMVRRAQAGRYQRMEVNRGLPVRFLLQYFLHDQDEWEIKPELRNLCQFQQRSLTHTWPLFETFDGILLRNALYYFSTDTQRRILHRVYGALQPDGFLILGSGEQPSPATLWQPVLDCNTCYYTPRQDHTGALLRIR
jgi:chemotaxis protein methyltransferase CheR